MVLQSKILTRGMKYYEDEGRQYFIYISENVNVYEWKDFDSLYVY